MTTVYVAQSSAGANDGSSVENARSITWFNTNASAGNTYVMCGAFSSTATPANSGTEGSPITMLAHPELGAYFVPTGASSGINVNGRNYVTADGISIDTRGTTGNGLLIQSGAKGIRLVRATIQALAGSCVALSSTSATAYEGITVEDSALLGGVTGVRFLGTVGGLGHTGIKVRNCDILGQTNEGVRLTVEAAGVSTTISDVEVSNSRIKYTLYQSVSLRQVYAAADDNVAPIVWAYGTHIYGNDISDCGTAGVESGSIHVLGAEHVRIWNNDVHRCYTKGALIQGQRRKDVRIYGNRVSGAVSASGIDGNGIFADRFDTNVRIYMNWVSDCPGVDGSANAGSGISLWMCDTVLVYCNVIARCRTGFNLGGNGTQAVLSSKITCNTVLDCAVGLESDNDGAGMAADAVEVMSNLFLRCGVGIDGRGRELSVAHHNAFEGCGAAYVNQTQGTGDMTSGSLVTAAGIPLPGSPLLNQGADLGLRRDIRGFQGRKFIGAYGPARLVAE